MENTPVTRNILYRFAFSKVLVIVLASLLCACLVISVANDLFAFIKPSQSRALEIRNMSVGALSRLLQQEGIIDNAFAFHIYAYLKGKNSELEDISGSVTLSSDMSYGEILNILLKI